jgi:hypothetical protein
MRGGVEAGERACGVAADGDGHCCRRRATNQHRGALTWVAAKALSDAAAAIRDAGDLSALAAQLPLERWFGSDQDHPR